MSKNTYDNPTKKQLDFIESLQDFCGAPDFDGNTKQKASDYIDKYKFMAVNDWSIENGY